ncbi:MAG: hypothetical protein EOO39_07805, partial [Cytophagaceae bacterium]
MKQVLTLLIGLGILACGAPSKAQDEQKIRKDHTYSTHNYKHPNKVAKAREWESKEGVTVQTPSLQDPRFANYKNQRPGLNPVGGVTVPHTLNEELANRNYKMQKPSIGTSQDS